MAKKTSGRPAQLGFSVLVLICVTAPAAADDRIASSGFYAEAGAGATIFYKRAGDAAKIGPSFEFRTGYDLFSWFSVGVYLSGSSHEATVPPPPEGEYYQLYMASADGRLGFLLGPVGIFAEGGVGAGMVSSNILARAGILDPGEQFSLLYRAGGGLEYQLRNRHYAFGLAGQWVSLPDFRKTKGMITRLYLRYTY